eukprot:TRINITY_DN17490_c0_g1_i1.p1 TRINITY_DN17490_c0_g1~~TRINITY_DN17490_c0_g1_i1.p1  ORF type:complete len:513 (+),score=78.39 TRINITY_DN17490_c0_g1_i1:1-1539(+)
MPLKSFDAINAQRFHEHLPAAIGAATPTMPRSVFCNATAGSSARSWLRWGAMLMLSELLDHAAALATFASRGSEIDVPLEQSLALSGTQGMAWPFSKKNDNTSARSTYMREKMHVDSLVIEQVHKRYSKVPPAAPANRRKVAFLFMVMDKLVWESIWEQFFEGQNKAKYSIYVHRALEHDLSARKDPLPLSKYQAQHVPWVNSTWCALFGLEVALLRAALVDPTNAQFVFVSHDTVPLKSFEYVFDNLIVRSAETSKFCLATPAKYKYLMVEEVVNELQTVCCFRDFYSPIDNAVKKHHQWIVLARSHAMTIVARALDGLARFSQVWKLAAPDVSPAIGCSDESVPITTLLLDEEESRKADDSFDGSELSISERMERIGVEENCLTFVNWYNCFRHTEFMLEGMGFAQGMAGHGSDLYRYLFEKDFDFDHDSSMNSFPTVYDKIDGAYLARLTEAGFMFARKFPVNVSVSYDGRVSNASLATILPALWEALKGNEEAARLAVWTRLQRGHAP